MKHDKNLNLSSSAAELRRHAEERLRGKTEEVPPCRSEHDLQRLVHELQVHQIELEMQNEELCLARENVETALEKYTELYDFAPVGYVSLEQDGVISSVNLRGAGLLGIERSQLIGVPFVQQIAVADRPAFSDFLGTLFSSQRKETCEVTLLNKGEFPLIMQIEAKATAAGQACRLALIDITRRRMVEDALRVSEERMYKLAEMASDAIIMMDDNELVTFCNAAAERMFGCPATEILGRNFHLLFIPEHHRTAAKHGFERFKAQGTGPLIGTKTEVVACRKDGTEFPLELSVSTLVIKGKRHAIGIMRDLTERKLAEGRISEVMGQQQAILDNIPHIAWLRDREGRYVAVNEPFSKVFGLAPGDLVGKQDHDIYPPELAAKYEQDLREVLASGRRTCFEETIVDREGAIRHLEKFETPIFNDAGEIIGIIGIAHDITGRKQIEVKLRHESTHDMLTGLHNRAFFEQELERFAHGRMFPVSIVMADVNGLKTVNDSLGHDAGDRLIRLAARLMLGAFRSEDIVARIGGDEFVALLPQTDETVALDAVERIRSSPEMVRGEVSIAFGIASAENREQLAGLLKLGDERMYREKSKRKESS